MNRPRNDKLLPYSCYSRGAGSEEAAILVFAHTAREAKKTAWHESGIIHDICDDDYLDLGVTRLRVGEHIYNREYIGEGNTQAFHDGIPFVNDDPPSCHGCNMWGEKLNAEGYCKDCEHENQPR